MRNAFQTTLLAMTALAAAPAAAQEREDEIVVTATRTPTPQERLPARVDVIEVDEAAERGLITLDQALSTIPGFQILRAGSIGQQASIFSGGFDSSHTLVLFDGVAINDPSASEAAFDAGQDTLGDANRIEVVQGPMSALYGSSALGGVVNVLPRRGGDGAFNPRLAMAAGAFETLTGNVGADGTLGNFRYAVNAGGYSSSGYDTVPERISTHSGEEDGANITTLTGVFDYAFSDSFAVDLLLRKRDALVETDYDTLNFAGDIIEADDAEQQSDYSLWRLGATLDASDTLSLRFSGGAFDTDRLALNSGVVSDEYHGVREFADFATTWSLDAWTILAGAQIENEEIDAVSFGSPVVGDQEHWGAYLASQGALGALDVTAALRHDDYEGFGGKTTWRVGGSYRFGEAARVYAAYGTSYRAPAMYERFVPGFGNPDLEPESAESWEVGAAIGFAAFGRADGLEVGALYRSSDVADLIGSFPLENIDRADIAFWEARVTLRPTDWLTARVSYANTDAVNADTGVALSRRAEDAWGAALEVERGPLSAQLAWRRIGERLDTTYDDAGACCGSGEVPAYEVLDASMAWSLGEGARVYVAANNIADEEYEPVNGFAGAPANVLVGLRLTP